MKYYFQIAGTFTGRVSVPLKSFNAGVICSSFHTMTLSSSSVGKSTKGMLQVVDRMAPPAMNVTVRGVVKLPKLTRTRYAANKRVLANMSLGPPEKPKFVRFNDRGTPPKKLVLPPVVQPLIRVHRSYLE